MYPCITSHTTVLCLALLGFADDAPREAADYVTRGMQRFQQNKIVESIRDFDEAARLEPRTAPHLWQRGISYYYAGQFEKGRKQFELHESVNPHDVENAAWHYLCVARVDGVKAARQALIKIDTRRDTRVPMAEVYELYAGRGSEERVLAAAKREGTQRALMYAHLYLGLYHEVIGNTDRARLEMKKAATARLQGHYMHEVAKIHLQQRQASAFVWTAEDAPPADKGGLERISIRSRAAVRFDAAQKSSVNLTSQYAWRELDGPCTVRLVFQLTGPPQGKIPLVSKWQMIDGGRSFEIGVLADGRPYFDVSASGNWDDNAYELTGACRILPRNTYCLAAVFDPGTHMSLVINGIQCAAESQGVPDRLHANNTPVLLGAQPPGHRWADVAVAELRIDRRALPQEELATWATSLALTELPTLIKTPEKNERMDLSVARTQILDYCNSLQVIGEPYGALRKRALPNSPVTLYATCDVAWIRACMGEDLIETLTPHRRSQWVAHINSFARPDGTYENPNHGEMHRNGMVVGALAVLGGKQKYPVSLYDQFKDPEDIEPWLEQIRWDRQWGASHLFWGGMHCYSMSRQCSQQWRNLVFDWLDANLDPKTGWWRKGVPQAGRHIEVLGGAAHIWPIYQHHRRQFPYPKRVIDSILAMQRSDGSWLGFSNYMELDALYGLAYMHRLVPEYRDDGIAAAARRHGRLVQHQYASFLSSSPDTHVLLSVVGTLALLQELDPDHFQDNVRWSDIFSDRKFYATDRVEILPDKVSR